MNNKKKALLLSSVLSLGLLCGCGSSNSTKSIETEDGIYIEQNGEYVKLNLEVLTFEPGTHIIQYNQYIGDNYVYNKHDGWGNSNIEIPEVPEGYRYVETITIDEGGYGKLNAIIHVYVNVDTVEVTPVYNESTGKIEYSNPGKVVEEQKLIP